MKPSPEEISAGQKAYQGLLAYQRFATTQRSKLSIFIKAFLGLSLGAQILASIYFRHYGKAIFTAMVLIVALYAWRSMEEAKRKNFEILKQLKAKYGVEIYNVIKTEPDSIQYRLFQKTYPSGQPQPAIELP